MIWKKIFTVALFFSLAGLAFFIYLTQDPAPAGDTELIVYETDVEGPEDCTSYEQYRPRDKVCYYECETESDCDQISAEIESELDSWGDEYGAAKNGGETASADMETHIQAAYTISGGEKLQLASGTDTPEYREVWENISKLSPDRLSDQYVSDFQVFDDQKDDTLAFVDDEDSDGKWRIAVNISSYRRSSPRENASTLIHEIGHLITLNSQQIVSGTDRCDTYTIDEGCAHKNSYLYMFNKKFWGGQTQAEYSPDKFVTEYAATNDVEDIAESFAFYVLEKNVSDSQLRDLKVAFFSEYPELEIVRRDMRKALAKDIVRAKKRGL